MTQIKAPARHLLRNGQLIDMSGDVLFEKTDPYFGCNVEVHRVPNYGNVLFIDGEVQISERDFELYHQAMLAFVPFGSDLLVVGDGDGGFTNRPNWNITQVEMSSVVRQAAEVAFDIDWTETDKYKLHSQTLMQYLLDSPENTFDAAFLAITDDFNADKNNFDDVLSVWNRLRPGGVLVAQVGCVKDPNFEKYLNNYSLFESSLNQQELSRVSISEPYISCFHSGHRFHAYFKGGV
jgi:spermidine synthase